MRSAFFIETKKERTRGKGVRNEPCLNDAYESVQRSRVNGARPRYCSLSEGEEEAATKKQGNLSLFLFFFEHSTHMHTHERKKKEEKKEKKKRINDGFEGRFRLGVFLVLLLLVCLPFSSFLFSVLLVLQ